MILKEGSQEVKAKDSVPRNIASAGKALGMMFVRCLGPNGMNILVSDEKGDTFYAHDAFTALEAIRNTMSHPVARLVHEAVKTIDKTVGDGGKTFCILLGDVMKHAEKLREQGVRPANIISGYSMAIDKCLEVLEKTAVHEDAQAIPNIVDTVLSRLPLTVVERRVLSSITLEAVEHAVSRTGDHMLDTRDIRVKNKLGADITSSFLVKGLIVDKVWPGHIQMPQYIERPRIALITSPIEVKKSTLKYEFTVAARDVIQLKGVVDDVSELYREAAERIHKSGATLVLSRKELHDQVLERLARLGIMAAYRFDGADIEFMSKATGARPVHGYGELSPEVLGEAERAMQVKIGGDRWIIIDGCRNSGACTIVLRANSYKSLKMYEKAVTKSLNAVSAFLKNRRVVPGGGAAEMHMATVIRSWNSLPDGQKWLAVQALAECLERIPFQLAINAGKDGVATIAKLRSIHLAGGHHYGVLHDGSVGDTLAAGVVEPLAVKRTILNTLRETVTQLLRIENVVISRQIKGNVTTR